TNSGKRAAKIVDNMLSFSRKSESAFAPHNLGLLLDQTLELAENDYDLKKKFDFRQIEIIREYALDMPETPCEASKIQQVFLNILKNGAQAMAEDVLDAEYRGSPRFILRVFMDGDMSRVEIEDNGPGMDDATRKRVFEPFYTTKGIGVGTGLGLSVSYFIITENHNGSMAVESAPGKGARFIIRLPRRKMERKSELEVS
ncbi:MAG: histidine kinase, partial [Desulfobacterales bacterium]|nr:histidine kinase [Desulfobacterales bacterium]